MQTGPAPAVSAPPQHYSLTVVVCGYKRGQPPRLPPLRSGTLTQLWLGTEVLVNIINVPLLIGKASPGARVEAEFKFHYSCCFTMDLVVCTIVQLQPIPLGVTCTSKNNTSKNKVQATPNTICIVFEVIFSAHDKQTNHNKLVFAGQIADPKVVAVAVHNASGKRGQTVAEGHCACAQAGMCQERAPGLDRCDSLC